MSDEKGMNPAALAAALTGDYETAVAASTPGGIERIEERDRDRMVEACELPMPIGGFPSDPIEAMEEMGFEILDHISRHNGRVEFLKVALPEGWEMGKGEMHRSSVVLDEKGRTRVTTFYKSAAYDPKGHTSFKRVLVVRSDYDWEGGTETERRVAVFTHDDRRVHVGGVYDLGADKYWEDEKDLREACEDWIADRFPEYKHPAAHWDEVDELATVD